MSLQMMQVDRHLEDFYAKNIDASDLGGRPKNEVDVARKSRALCAFALNMLTSVDRGDACDSVVDGFNDNGIDAIYYSSSDLTLYFVQSKYHKDGNGSIDLGDLNKFLKGCQDIIQGKFEKFNNKVISRKSEILSVLLNASNRFKLVVIHSGGEKLSTHCQTEIDEFLGRNNEIGEKFYFTAINIRDIYSYISSGFGRSPINTDVAIYNWGHIEKPIKSIYGQIAGSDLAGWLKDHGPSLFSPNIRYFLGVTEVNDGIRETINGKPENFWYYNNGITVLCDKFDKKGIGGDSRESGIFECKNIKVVNGAQTVGSLHAMLSSKNPTSITNLGAVRVWVRIIEAGDQDVVSTEITKYNNTQNRIEKRDFVSIDPQQKRIYDELRLDGVAYLYKSGETAIAGSKYFDLTEATIARACCQDDIQNSVQAKREISKLWEIDSSNYKMLFNKGVHGPNLYREVCLMRCVDSYIEKKNRLHHGGSSLLLTHGNRFFLYSVAQELKERIYSDEVSEIVVAPIIDRDFNLAASIIEDCFQNSYLANLFKNSTKCKELWRAMKLKLAS